MRRLAARQHLPGAAAEGADPGGHGEGDTDAPRLDHGRHRLAAHFTPVQAHGDAHPDRDSQQPSAAAAPSASSNSQPKAPARSRDPSAQMHNDWLETRITLTPDRVPMRAELLSAIAEVTALTRSLREVDDPT